VSPSNSTGYCDRCALDALLASLDVEYPLPEPVEYPIPTADYTPEVLEALLAEPDLSALLERPDCGGHE
jgi:hypothetical protein